MDKEKAIQFKHLKELHRINPDISAGDLIKLAEYYIDTCANTDNTIKNQGDTVHVQYVPSIEVRQYIEGKEKALEEYKQKFLADIEKLKAEKEKGEKMLDTMLKAFGELKNATPRSEGVCWIPEEYIPMLEAELDKRYNENEVK